MNFRGYSKRKSAGRNVLRFAVVVVLLDKKGTWQKNDE
jgi:hypothetical protein